MALNFPSSPTVGQTFTSGALTYVFDGTAWNSVLDTSFTLVPTQDLPPSSPRDGQLWFESSTGALLIYYDDGTSSQWVQINALAG